MDALVLLAVLVCPILMGTMMFLMSRAMRGGNRMREGEPTSSSSPTNDG